MIINTGQRTDIPAFYSEWFANRLREGFVCVRNPFNINQVNRYELNPSVVDLIGFCSKNPGPIFPYLDLLSDYGQYWFVTITPYGKEIEPNIPDKNKVLEDFKTLSLITGINGIAWRYDPILLSERYTAEYHIDAFEKIATVLEGYTETVVISFIDLYKKVVRNFPEARVVSREDMISIGKELIRIAGEHGMVLKTCAEGDILAPYGADCRGCMTIETYEKAIGKRLIVPNFKPNREECACYLACDIGAYDSCMHMCRYCYANNDTDMVLKNFRAHDKRSPFLTGHSLPGDVVHKVPQKSWVDPQLNLFGMI